MCEFCLSHIHKIDIRQAATDEFSGGACTLFGQIYHLADNGSIVAFCIRCYATDGVFIPIDCQQLIYRILKFRYSVSTRLLIMLRSEYSSGLLKSPMKHPVHQ